jgi:hypothetical protein
LSHIFINLTCRGGGALPTDDQHGCLRPESIGNAGDRISSARTGGDDGDARLASDARPGIGSMRCRLLVPHVNDFDALVEAAVVDINNVPPAESKNGLNALGLQSASHQMAPTNLGYNIAPVGMSLDSEYSRMALRLLRFCS